MIRTLANPAAQHLVSFVAQTHGSSVPVLLSRCRYPRISQLRAICCWLLYEHYEYGYAEIGRLLGLNHSSVIYAVRRVDRDPVLRFEANETMATLRALATAALPAQTERTA